MIRLVVADDHPLLREGIRRIVDTASDMSVIAEASTGREAIRQTRQTKPDVLLLDISMPDGGGLEALRQLKETTRILILSMHGENQYGVRMLKEGAAGYLTKCSAPQDLVSAIRRIHAGGRYVSWSLADRLVASLNSGLSKEPHEKLSTRELQILCLLGSGRCVSEIARELAISVKTVSTHRTRILHKMDMKHNGELICYVVSKGLSTAAQTG